MALARVARSGLRRSGGSFGCNRIEDVFCEGVSPCQCSMPSLENVREYNNLSYFSSTKNVNHMRFWSRGIRVMPHYHSPAAEMVADVSDSEYDEPRYPTLEATNPGEKPRVVVLGTRWAACRFLGTGHQDL